MSERSIVSRLVASRSPLLDLPAMALVPLVRRRDRRAGRWLRGMCEAMPFATGRELLRELRRSVGRSEARVDAEIRAAVLGAIEAVVDEAVEAVPPALRLSPRPPVADGQAALRSWAQALGIGGRLGTPCLTVLKLRMAKPSAERLLKQLGLSGQSVEEALLAAHEREQQHRGRYGYRHLDFELERVAVKLRQFLASAAGEQHDRALAAADPPADSAAPPTDPFLAALMGKLLELWRPLFARHGPRPFAPVGSRALLAASDAPPRLVYVEQRTEIHVDLSRWRDAPLTLAGREAARAEALTAVEEMIDLISSPLSDERDTLRTMAGAPVWSRLLDGIERLASGAEREAPAAAEGFVSWRVDPHGFKPTPYVHRPLKKGGFSAGARAAVSALLDAPPRGILPQDQALLRALAKAQEDGSWSHAHHEERYQQLALLEGHPRVYLEHDTTRPVAVTKATVALRVSEHEDGGFVLEPVADGAPLQSGARRLAEAGVELLVDEDRGRLVLLRADARAAALVELLRRTPAVIPASEREHLVAALHRLERVVPVELPAALQGEPVEADPTLVARLTPLEGGALRLELGVRPLPGGRFSAPGEGGESASAVVDGRRVTARRDLDGERARASQLLELLPLDEPDDPERPVFTLPRLEDGLALLAALDEAKGREGAPAVRVEWPEGARRLTVTRAASAKDLRVQLRRGRDWLDLDGGLEVDGGRLELARLLDAARRGERYVTVGDGSFVPLGERLLKDLARIAHATRSVRGKHEIGPQAAAVLDELEGAGATVDGDETWRGLRQRFTEAMQGRPKLPRGLDAELRPYQREGFEWLWRLARWGVGGVLADDMGLGKTVQAIAMLVERESLGPQLVVAPTSVCFNWQRECERFAPSLRPRLFAGAGREGMIDDLGERDVLIVSYGVLARDAGALKKLRFATAVLDEAQAMKNAATKRARAARELDAEWRIALTGTPLENHLGELWSIFRVASPGLLGSWEQFRKELALPIERDGSAAHRRALSRMVRPFLLRRTKREVAEDLPPRTEIQRLVQLSDAERALYEQTRLAVVASVEEAEGDPRFRVLAGITRLRLAACHPALEDPEATLSSSKLEAVLELLQEIKEGEHRALVFSQFTKHLALVRAALEQNGISYLYLDGGTPQAERARLVDAFQDGSYDAFLISLKAGGTGLNLTAADYVLHLDPWWNPAVEDQATDRAHRIGQERPVTVYRLISRGTIEEKIVKLHAEKRELVDSVLEGTGAAAGLSVEELRGLLEGR